MAPRRVLSTALWGALPPSSRLPIQGVINAGCTLVLSGEILTNIILTPSQTNLIWILSVCILNIFLKIEMTCTERVENHWSEWVLLPRWSPSVPAPAHVGEEGPMWGMERLVLTDPAWCLQSWAEKWGREQQFSGMCLEDWFCLVLFLSVCQRYKKTKRACTVS